MPEDKGKEILRQMREDTGSKRYIDQEKEQLRKDADRVIHSGTLDEFREILRRAGVDPESARGKLLIDRLITLGASGRSPR
jgi:hypothetical protein